MAQTDIRADVKVVLNIEISEELKALLTAQGWTPPGEEPILNSDRRRILAEQAFNHRSAMSKLQTQHREQLERMAEEHSTALRAERIKTRSEIRAEVAEEIAVDLEKPREWRISLDKLNPWAAVARKHAGGKPSEIPFPADRSVCFTCGHLAEWHSQLAGGCAGASPRSIGCACTLNHGNQ